MRLLTRFYGKAFYSPITLRGLSHVCLTVLSQQDDIQTATNLFLKTAAVPCAFYNVAKEIICAFLYTALVHGCLWLLLCLCTLIQWEAKVHMFELSNLF